MCGNLCGSNTRNFWCEADFAAMPLTGDGGPATIGKAIAVETRDYQRVMVAFNDCRLFHVSVAYVPLASLAC
jgi:hypothetical protein